MDGFSDKQIAELLEGVYDGDITEYDLPADLYYAIADYLKKGLYKGFGGELTDFEIDSTDHVLLTELRENIYMFSAAKTYQQVKQMSEALTDNHSLRSFKDFKEEAKSIFDQYNVDYLRAEYDTAIASGQMGARWNDIEENKKVLPYLKISVVEDANTSEICAPLDGICLPVDNDFWDEYYPPNHWNCRSTVEQLDEEEGKDNLSSDGDVTHAKEHANEDMQDIFKMNVGKDHVVFSDEHPYFDVEKKDQGFARDNFDLPIPVKD